MFGIGWTEFVVIGLVLLIFVGPKQLPSLLRKVGLVIGDLKSASRDLRTQVTDEVRDLQNDIGDLRPKSIIKDAMNDLTYDIRSPYDDAKRAKDGMGEEISKLKTEFQDLTEASAEKAPESPTIKKPPSKEASQDLTEASAEKAPESPTIEKPPSKETTTSKDPS